MKPNVNLEYLKPFCLGFLNNPTFIFIEFIIPHFLPGRGWLGIKWFFPHEIFYLADKMWIGPSPDYSLPRYPKLNFPERQYWQVNIKEGSIGNNIILPYFVQKIF